MFLKDIFRYHQNNANGHPFYKIYITIRAALGRSKNDPAELQFKDFVGDLFKEVFTALDREDEVFRSRAEDVLRLSGKLKRISWDEISLALRDGKTIELDREHLESLIQEQVHKHEGAVARAISHQNSILNRVIENPLLLKRGNEQPDTYEVGTCAPDSK